MSAKTELLIYSSSKSKLIYTHFSLNWKLKQNLQPKVALLTLFMVKWTVFNCPVELLVPFVLFKNSTAQTSQIASASWLNLATLETNSSWRGRTDEQQSRAFGKELRHAPKSNIKSVLYWDSERFEDKSFVPTWKIHNWALFFVPSLGILIFFGKYGAKWYYTTNISVINCQVIDSC